MGSAKIEDALARLDRLTNEEIRMAAAEGLKATHDVDNKVQAIDVKVQSVDNKVQDIKDKVQGVDDRVRDVDDKVDLIIDGVQFLSNHWQSPYVVLTDSPG